MSEKAQNKGESSALGDKGRKREIISRFFFFIKIKGLTLYEKKSIVVKEFFIGEKSKRRRFL